MHAFASYRASCFALCKGAQRDGGAYLKGCTRASQRPPQALIPPVAHASHQLGPYPAGVALPGRKVHRVRLRTQAGSLRSGTMSSQKLNACGDGDQMMTTGHQKGRSLL